jgi:hypothetical protein
MVQRLLFVGSLSLLAGSSALIAQQQTPQEIRLQLEEYKNGVVVGKPIVRVRDGGTVTLLPWEGMKAGSLTPKRVAADQLEIACDFTVNGKKVQPSLLIHGSEPASLSWKSDSGSDAFELRLFAIQ